MFFIVNFFGMYSQSGDQTLEDLAKNIYKFKKRQKKLCFRVVICSYQASK